MLYPIARGESRILPMPGTGTSTTSIALQIAWKLYHARWTLARGPVRRPYILFLADPADTPFGAFPPDPLCRIGPDEIGGEGKFPTNAYIYIFMVFRTFTIRGGEFTRHGYPW